MELRQQSSIDDSKGGKEKRIGVTLPPDTAKILEETAEAENRSQANVAQTILRDWANGKAPSIKPHKEEDN
jgi:hypothetical protein